ncbi:MAG: ATPase domain-containing protein [Candidatus Thorarchaeota archaeon]
MILPSGVSKLDRLLNGGIHTGLFTHIYGEAASGKTTLALQFVSAAVKLGIHSIYVNSEGSSPIERFQQISGHSISEVSNLVQLFSPKDFDEQGGLIENLDLYARKDTRLIVMDTLTRLYRIMLEDRTSTYAAHRELNRQTGFLKGLAKERDVAIIVLNQVRSTMKGLDDIEPVAGNILDYWSDYVIHMRPRKQQGERQLKLIAPKGMSSEIVLHLTSSGFSIKSPHEKQ